MTTPNGHVVCAGNVQVKGDQMRMELADGRIIGPFTVAALITPEGHETAELAAIELGFPIDVAGPIADALAFCAADVLGLAKHPDWKEAKAH